MRINDLAKLTSINKETIRSYRKMGFLHPVRDKNGYYDYSENDLISLLYLGKLRREDLSLENIHSLYYSDRGEDLDTVFDEAEEKIQAQIVSLQRSLRFLEFEKRHIHESLHADGSLVTEMQSIDEKLDFYGLFKDPAKWNGHLAAFLQMTTPSLFISKEVLNGAVEDRMIPLRVGIGSYRYLIEEWNITIPHEDTVVVPNGICLSQILVLHDLQEVNVLELAPLMNYAKEHGRSFISDTTGYLMRTEYRDGDYVFYFRIRACVEKNDIKDMGNR